MHVLISTQLNTWWEFCAVLTSSFWAQLSFLSSTLLSKHFQPVFSGFNSISSIQGDLETFPRQWAGAVQRPTSFTICQRPLTFVFWFSMSLVLFFHTFRVIFLVASGEKIKLVLVTPCWPEEGVPQMCLGWCYSFPFPNSQLYQNYLTTLHSKFFHWSTIPQNILILRHSLRLITIFY